MVVPAPLRHSCWDWHSIPPVLQLNTTYGLNTTWPTTHEITSVKIMDEIERIRRELHEEQQRRRAAERRQEEEQRHRKAAEQRQEAAWLLLIDANMV